MKSTDPASLQNLNDIVLPTAVNWWPLAAGWYVLLGSFLLAVAWFGYQAWKHWGNNRYRRAALNELQLLTATIQTTEKHDASLRQLPVLLKRTALSAYPRDIVAPLSGDDWYQFLNAQLKKPSFTATSTGLLDNISYSSGDLSSIDSQATTTLLNAIKHWLRYHQPPARLEAGRGK